MGRGWADDYGKPPHVPNRFGFGSSTDSEDSDDDGFGMPSPSQLMVKDQVALMSLESATYCLSTDLCMWKVSRLRELKAAKELSLQASKAERESTLNLTRKLQDLEQALEKQENDSRKSNNNNKQQRGKEGKVQGVVGLWGTGQFKPQNLWKLQTSL